MADTSDSFTEKLYTGPDPDADYLFGAAEFLIKTIKTKIDPDEVGLLLVHRDAPERLRKHFRGEGAVDVGDGTLFMSTDTNLMARRGVASASGHMMVTAITRLSCRVRELPYFDNDEAVKVGRSLVEPPTRG